MADPDQIASLQERLEIHRRNLAHRLRQQARGNESLEVINDIRDQRTSIKKIKQSLQRLGISVPDHEDDEPGGSAATAPAQNVSSIASPPSTTAASPSAAVAPSIAPTSDSAAANASQQPPATTPPVGGALQGFLQVARNWMKEIIIGLAVVLIAAYLLQDARFDPGRSTPMPSSTTNPTEKSSESIVAPTITPTLRN